MLIVLALCINEFLALVEREKVLKKMKNEVDKQYGPFQRAGGPFGSKLGRVDKKSLTLGLLLVGFEVTFHNRGVSQVGYNVINVRDHM